jgi:F-type H+-transporting ATPase subunit delta
MHRGLAQGSVRPPNHGAIQAKCTSIAGRYAVALFEVATSQGALERTLAECEVVNELLDAKNQHRALFIRIIQGHIPGVDELKQRANFQPFFVNFLKTLAQNQRINLLKIILRIFTALVNQSLNRAAVTVYTAEEIADSHKKNITDKLTALFKQTLLVTYKVAPHILGGMLIQSDLLTIDVSVKHQIDAFTKEALSQVRVV